MRHLRLVAQRHLQDGSPVVRPRRAADSDGWHSRSDTAHLTGTTLFECDPYVLRGRVGVRHGTSVRWSTRTLVAAYAPIGCS